MTYEAFIIDTQDRERLLVAFPPKNPDVIAHHVTHRFGVPADAVYGITVPICVIGYKCAEGIEALVVEINDTFQRPDGNIYHITLSIDRSKGIKPMHSNQLLEDGMFTQITPFMISGVFQHCR